jgi:hypothetical protein
VHGRPRTDQRGRETTERLRDEDDVARPDRLEDAVGIGREASVLVVTRQVDRDRLVLRFFEEAHDTMPVPSDTAGARNENEGGHSRPGVIWPSGRGR